MFNMLLKFSNQNLKFQELVCKDIAEIKTSEIPDHDVLTAELSMPRTIRSLQVH